LYAGRKPRQDSDELTVGALCNRFIANKEVNKNLGRIQQRTFAEYFRCCRLLVDELGRNRPVTDLRPDDFERLYEKLSSMYGLTTVGREISMVRSVFKYAVESDLIDRAVKFGPSFKAPSKREHRKRKGEIERRHGKMMFQAAEIRVTLTGTFYCCRTAGGIMERQESGSIVNISSINGQNPAALVAAYNVAKAGVISLTKTLALELAAYGVRVNAVCPGPVYTDFNKTVMAQRCESLDISEEQMIERVRQAIPRGRWGKPEDIAHQVAFLCSPAADWVTGEVLRVSGGLEGVSAAPPKRTRS
jgi:NAD(P)-dependent dehydrogenase (short-subunit alcohol dehydrogenase family)